mgnify:CR=1 FL=1
MTFPLVRRTLLAAALALPAAAALAAPLTMGFSQVGAESEWRTANTASIKAAAKAAGITLKFADAQQKQENQVKAIRSFIAQKVDVIAFSPVVESGWDTVLKEAKAAGIPVSAPVAGMIEQLAVAPGDNVRRGQVLARLAGPQGLELQRDALQASAQATLQQQNLKRDEQLFAEGLIAESRLQATRAAAAQATAQAGERRQGLALAGLASAALAQSGDQRVPRQGGAFHARWIFVHPRQRRQAFHRRLHGGFVGVGRGLHKQVHAKGPVGLLAYGGSGFGHGGG